MKYPTSHRVIITKKHANRERTFTIGYYDFTKKWIPVKDIRGSMHKEWYEANLEVHVFNRATT